MPSSNALRSRWRGAIADIGAVTALCVLVGLVAWNRLAFDSWLGRFDIFTQYLPWFGYLGRRLRQGEVPAWNPYQFGGTPFAGDPQSDWMYLPAMLWFALLPVLTGFKAMVATELAVAAAGTYGLARALGLAPLAAFIAAAAFVGGPVPQWNTYCCLVMGQFAVWVPLALLGIELAVRRQDRRTRVAGWAVAGFALSQLFAAWVGEGWLDALLLVGGYAVARGLFGRAERRFVGRAVETALVGAAVVGLGAALGAAGILPRLAVNRESNLAGGNYAGLGAVAANQPAWSPSTLFGNLLGAGYEHRLLAPGGAVLVLALLAPFVARGRGAVPFFAVVTAVSLVLPLGSTPLHELFYAIPRFRVLHEHDPWRSAALGVIGPPMLAAATVDALARGGVVRLFRWLLAPAVILAATVGVLEALVGSAGWEALLCTGIAALAGLALAGLARRGQIRPWGTGAAATLLALAVVAQPVGLELTGSWFGWPHDRSWNPHWHPPAIVGRVVAAEVSPTDPDGAGAFLQERLAVEGPFRFLGYGETDSTTDPERGTSYMARRFDPAVRALLVNGRSVFLGLYDVQGYNPVELARYAAFMTAVNGMPQNYHLADLLPSGTASRLLDLLDVRYVVIERSLPADRPDVAALIADRVPVFRDARVVIYQTEPPPRHAWLVHEVRSVAPGAAASMLASGKVDPRRVALVDGPTPAIATAAATETESAEVSGYAPEAVTVAVDASAPGLLVVSEIAASGWRATVDGVPAPIVTADGVLRAVPVSAGRHTVVMRYQPRALTLGLRISGLASVVLVVALAATLMWRPGRWRRGKRGSGLRGAWPRSIISRAAVWLRRRPATSEIAAGEGSDRST